MAMSNWNNTTRAADFIKKAVEKKQGAGPHDQLWIEAYADYWLGKKPEKERREELVRRLEDISYQYRDDLEAKAFLVFHLWDNHGKGVPMNSRKAVDAILGEIFAAEPMHPAHHYRIHLWDTDKAERALAAAARCGQSAPT